MRVLVLGARGFLGRYVVEALVRRGLETFAASRSPAPAGTRLPGVAEEVAADLEAPDSLAKAFDRLRPAAVVNCAAYGLDPGARDPEPATRTNVLGPVAALRAAERAGVGRFIHFGTCFEFGSQEAPVDEATPLRPHGLYATTKAAASLLLEDLARESKVDVVLLRPFVMVGLGERPAKLVPQLVSAARNRQPLLLTEGHEVRDYVDVGFVADATAALASLPAGAFPRAQSFCLCSGEPRTVRQFAEELASALGIADLLRFGARPSRNDVPAKVVGNPSRWTCFARALPPPAPLASRPLSDVLRELAAKAVP